MGAILTITQTLVMRTICFPVYSVEFVKVCGMWSVLVNVVHELEKNMKSVVG